MKQVGRPTLDEVTLVGVREINCLNGFGTYMPTHPPRYVSPQPHERPRLTPQI